MSFTFPSVIICRCRRVLRSRPNLWFETHFLRHANHPFKQPVHPSFLQRVLLIRIRPTRLRLFQHEVATPTGRCTFVFHVSGIVVASRVDGPIGTSLVLIAAPIGNYFVARVALDGFHVGRRGFDEGVDLVDSMGWNDLRPTEICEGDYFVAGVAGLLAIQKHVIGVIGAFSLRPPEFTLRMVVSADIRSVVDVLEVDVVRILIDRALRVGGGAIVVIGCDARISFAGVFGGGWGSVGGYHCRERQCKNGRNKEKGA
mmetsp:Transcript_17910/g.37436  ORF Transcript_17910/g.37436 Transcript_17910/m.37436 type:complete len:257 (-) Transcript_17910:55-825(-)